MPVTILTSCFQQVRFKNVSTKLKILSEPASLESICHHIKYQLPFNFCPSEYSGS